MPHVVRVTFLGIAGLLAKAPSPCSDGNADESGSAAAAALHVDGAGTGPPLPITAPTAVPGAEPCALLFPLPPQLRAVASVSRSRTARGIPSGMSRPLALVPSADNSSNRNSDPGCSGGGRSHRTNPPLLEGVSNIAMTGSFSLSPLGESIVVDNKNPSSLPPPQSSGSCGGKKDHHQLSIEEISIARQQSIGLDLFEGTDGTGSEKAAKSAKDESSRRHSRRRRKKSNSPPSASVQSLRSRSTSGESITGEISGNASSGQQLQRDCDDSAHDFTEGIEVIGPGTAGEILKQPRDGGGGVCSGQELEGGGHVKANKAERCVAIWDNGVGFKPSSTSADSAGATSSMAANIAPQFINLTNSLAFEAELRPAAAEARPGRHTPVASTTFAPKSFCVSVGLTPSGDPDDSVVAVPPFAVPVGVAELVINGNETLDGRRRQLDLPLSGLGNFAGSLPPLIELTTEGLAATAGGMSDEGGISPQEVKATNAGATAKEKAKRGGIVKRIFFRKQPPATAAEQTTAPARAYTGPDPRSVFRLGRHPNAHERALFLDRYGVDLAGDAIVRIGLEVFSRGSELEKVFRQKNRLRRRAALAAAGKVQGGGSNLDGEDRKGTHSRPRRWGSARTAPRGVEFSQASLAARSRDAADSRSRCSLADEDDEDGNDPDPHDTCSDDDSMVSQSFFTLDSDASRMTWDESTTYTNTLSSINTHDDVSMDSMSYTTGFTRDDGHRKSRVGGGGPHKNIITTNFLSSFLSCNRPTTLACGLDKNEEDIPRKSSMAVHYTNIDTVVEAMASMSMAESPKEDNALRTVHHQKVDGVMKQSEKSSLVDTAAQQKHQVIHPENVQESGEELTLDSIALRSASSVRSNTVLGSSRRLQPPVIVNQEDTVPAIDRATTSITIENETTPLAMIKQRFATSHDFDESLRARVRGNGEDGGSGKAEEGHEFTLEEHQSSM